MQEESSYGSSFAIFKHFAFVIEVGHSQTWD